MVVNFICVSGCYLFIALILFLNGTRENELSRLMYLCVCMFVRACVWGREGWGRSVVIEITGC